MDVRNTGLKFPKGTKKKKKSPTRQVSWEAGKVIVTYADNTDRLKSTTSLADPTGHYPNNTA